MSFVGFSASTSFQTIGEVQPPLQNASFADFVLSQYGLALAAVSYIFAHPLHHSDHILYIPAVPGVFCSVYEVPQLYDVVGNIVNMIWWIIGLVITAAFLIDTKFLTECDTKELCFVVRAALH